MFGVWFCWRSCSGFLVELQEVELEVDRISRFCCCWLMFFDVLPFVAAFQGHIVTLFVCFFRSIRKVSFFSGSEGSIVQESIFHSWVSLGPSLSQA